MSAKSVVIKLDIRNQQKNVELIGKVSYEFLSHRIHGAAIYGNMDPITISPMLAYIPYMDPIWVNYNNSLT